MATDIHTQSSMPWSPLQQILFFYLFIVPTQNVDGHDSTSLNTHTPTYPFMSRYFFLLLSGTVAKNVFSTSPLTG